MMTLRLRLLSKISFLSEFSYLMLCIHLSLISVRFQLEKMPFFLEKSQYRAPSSSSAFKLFIFYANFKGKVSPTISFRYSPRNFSLLSKEMKNSIK